MPTRRISLAGKSSRAELSRVSERIDDLVRESDAPDRFPAQVLAEAEASQKRWRGQASDHIDRTDIPFVTLDPEGSKDLDQAIHVEKTADGYRVRYAIADVPLFVPTESPLDDEARLRGLTVYLPDRRIPLHPEVLPEGAASLLPDHEAPAFVWDFDLDHGAAVRSVSLERALVRSREQLAYDTVQADLDAGRGHPLMLLLQEVGDKRGRIEIERGGASLGSPEQEVDVDGEHVRLIWRTQQPIEQANAQMSLMTGMAAAQIMIDGGTGILRTLPPASDEAIRTFRRQAAALREPWPESMPYGEFLRTLDWSKGRHLALLNQATKLFRGAGYEAFSEGRVPDEHTQAALAAPYAHTTAPLRRLVDRFSLAICHALVNNEPVDPALLAALPSVPSLMGSAQSRNSQIERAAKAIVESEVLSTLVGEELVGTIVGRKEARESHDGQPSAPARINVQFSEPPIAQWIDLTETDDHLDIGTKVAARVESIDPDHATAVFGGVTTVDMPATHS